MMMYKSLLSVHPLVVQGVDRCRHVSWLVRTRVDVAVILWQKVNIVEDEALVVV